MQTETIQTGTDGSLHGTLYRPQPDDIVAREANENRGLNDPSGEIPGGVFVAIHGLGDHSGHYQRYAQTAATHNWAVATMDLRGHGRSPGRRGSVHSYDSLLADIAALRRQASKAFPGVPQILVGHSMGGNLVANYSLRRNEFESEDENRLADPHGLALISPMLMPPTEVTRPQIFAAWLTGHVMPWFRVSKRASVRKLTTDHEQIQKIRADELRHGKLSIYLATQLLSQGRWAIDHAREIDVPTLLMYGEKDEMIDQPAVENAAVRIGKHATLVKWEQGLHDMLHDVDYARVEARIFAWIHALELPKQS